jgi:hypothetical protein
MKRLALGGLVAACALAPTALAAASLNGTYKATITGDRFGAAVNGKWKLVVSSGHYSAYHNGALAVKGVDTVTATQVTLRDTGGPGKCIGTGRYSYKLVGTQLTFKKISDAPACAGRADVLTHPFTKVS